MKSRVLDKRGIPIECGDIVKVFHFIGARRNRHYMYKQCLGIRSYPDGGPEYMYFSHLNFVDDPRDENGPYLVLLGQKLDDYEIVQSIKCDHETRVRQP